MEEQKEKTQEFRCRGENRKMRICNQLLFKYNIKGDEVTVICKCPSCNNFSIITIKLISQNHVDKKCISQAD